MTFDESVPWHKNSSSITSEKDHYVVAVPWRNKPPSLPNNRPLAEKALGVHRAKNGKESGNSGFLSEGH